MQRILSVLLFLFSGIISNAQIDQAFMVPPKEILDLVDVKPAPAVRIDSKAEYMVMLERNAFRSIEELAAEEVRLAGLRINPATNGPSRSTSYTGISIRHIPTGKTIAVTGLPASVKLGYFSFSPNEQLAAFTNTTTTGLELWMLRLNSGEATKISKISLNAVLGSPFIWNNDSKSLLCKTIVPGTPVSRVKPLPKGPTVQQTTGKKAPAITFQDLLKNKYDESLFEFFAQSEITKIGIDGLNAPFLNVGIYSWLSFSPDGKYLLVNKIQKPFSYLVQINRFSASYDLFDSNGSFVKTFYTRPLIEELPNGFDAVETGKRNIDWRDDQPATLFWTEAQDGGDPAKEVPARDHLYTLSAPFTGQPVFLAATKNRFSGITWGRNDLAIVSDSWWKTRQTITYMINPSKENKSPEILFDRSSEDVYSDPGEFHLNKNALDRYVLCFSKDGKKLYLTGEGCSPEGNKPFFDEFDIATKKAKRIWRADGKSTYESILRVLDVEKKLLLTSIESPLTNSNFYIRNAGSKSAPKQITSFPNPYQSFMGVTKERIKYKRKDGVELAGTLYLPKGYNKEKDGPLPVVMWAYPVEYKDKDQAGQIRTSPHEFVQLYYGSPVFWVMRGYAVLDDADFPIVGEGKNEPNDSFIEQLVANAEAAINTLSDLGVGDRKRVAVGGHSYGAFMTANLMAHCDLFAAGIARSGAYNRTLTPFGFQSEERTFWQAKELYGKMSPFFNADKINEPLLLIHGDADNNPGTFTLQSERLYAAIKGMGGTARLVLLPHESHGYSARENILHMLWEQDEWLEKYVKNKK